MNEMGFELILHYYEEYEEECFRKGVVPLPMEEWYKGWSL